MHRLVRGSPGRIRTCNLLLTVSLLLPKGLDYLIHVIMSFGHQRDRVYSLYTFPRLHFR